MIKIAKFKPFRISTLHVILLVCLAPHSDEGSQMIILVTNYAGSGKEVVASDVIRTTFLQILILSEPRAKIWT